MARPKGAKNKPKAESKPVEVKKSVEPKPQPENLPPKQDPKPEVKNFEEKPVIDAVINIPKNRKKKPTLSKLSYKGEDQKPKHLDFPTEPTKPKIPLKYLAVGIFGLGLYVAFTQRDKIIGKIVEWKTNRIADGLIKEGIEDISLTKEGA